MVSVAMCCVSSQNQVLHSNLRYIRWSKMVNLTKTRNFNGTIRFIGSNRVDKYSPQIYHVTLIFDVSHPKYVL